MSLKYLEIAQFRNLNQVMLEPDSQLNIISGVNASGKTSLLESLFYLSYGRSFRTSNSQDMISHGKDHFHLFARLLDHSQQHQIGIQRFKKEQQIRIDQQDCHRLSQLSALFPVIAIHPDSHFLISAGPEYRRQFMDWGVFHVEHGFVNEWRNYKKALSQRNASLRNHDPDRLCRIWHQAMVQHAEVIHELRQQYISRLSSSVDQFASILFPDNSITLDYKKGWGEQDCYLDYLESSLIKDRDKGYTQSGPHRADVIIKVDQQSAHTSISRGQQKKLVALLKLAQLDVFIRTTRRQCVVLYDDLPAELDTVNRQLLMNTLSSMQVQLFVTSIDPSSLDGSVWESCKMFHVERGVVNELNG